MNKTKILKLALDKIKNTSKQYKASIKPTFVGKAAKVKKTERKKIEDNLNKRMTEFANRLMSDTGFSYDPRLDEFYNLGEQRGFMMSPILNKNAVQFPYKPNITAQDIMNALPSNYIPRLQKGANLGSWIENNNVYLDPAERYMSKIMSLIKGLKAKQLSGADLKIPMPTNWDTQPSPFYDVNAKALAKLIGKRTGQAGTLGGTGYLGYAKLTEDEE